MRDTAALPKTWKLQKEAAKMRRRRSMSQMTEQNKTRENELNKMETSNLPDAEFKTLVIKIFSEFRVTE